MLYVSALTEGQYKNKAFPPKYSISLNNDTILSVTQ